MSGKIHLVPMDPYKASKSMGIKTHMYNSAVHDYMVKMGVMAPSSQTPTFMKGR